MKNKDFIKIESVQTTPTFLCQMQPVDRPFKHVQDLKLLNIIMLVTLFFQYTQVYSKEPI